MIDLHCHILPGIDDGPKGMEESLEMARIAASDGITRIVATPHVKDTLLPAEKIKDRIDVLNGLIRDARLDLEILQGADVYALLDPSLLAGYTIGRTRYILIEFPHTHLPRQAREIIFRMILGAYRPVITHPERNPSVIENPGRLFDLLSADVLVQMTADSITGAFGSEIRACAAYLLQKGAVHVMATDAHSAGRRRPILSEGVRAAAKIVGKEAAMKLVTANPEYILKGEPLNGV